MRTASRSNTNPTGTVGKLFLHGECTPHHDCASGGRCEFRFATWIISTVSARVDHVANSDIPAGYARDNLQFGNAKWPAEWIQRGSCSRRVYLPASFDDGHDSRVRTGLHNFGDDERRIFLGLRRHFQCARVRLHVDNSVHHGLDVLCDYSCSSDSGTVFLPYSPPGHEVTSTFSRGHSLIPCIDCIGDIA